MDNFINWFRNNSTQITWWVIGWMCFACIDALARGNYIAAAFDAFLIYFNYKMWKSNV